MKYTNRRGQVYYLHERTTRTGNPAYFFSMREEGTSVEEVPPGYEIHESPNGLVSLRRAQTRMIRDDEIRTVEQEFERSAHLRYCRADVKGQIITVHEPTQDVEELWEVVTRTAPGRGAEIRSLVEQSLSYRPVLRFVLVDEERRIFQTQRYCFRGSIDDWIAIGERGPLPRLARLYVEHVGRDSFFELF